LSFKGQEVKKEIHYLIDNLSGVQPIIMHIIDYLCFTWTFENSISVCIPFIKPIRYSLCENGLLLLSLPSAVPSASNIRDGFKILNLNVGRYYGSIVYLHLPCGLLRIFLSTG
jgi:hypothetical protein